MTPNQVSPTLTGRVAELKAIARNALRMNLISPRLRHIADFQTSIKNTNESIKEFKHEIEVETYEISKLDTNHPDFEKKKKDKEIIVEELNKGITCYEEQVTEFNKQVKEQEDGIAKIENGETKVSLESLNELVETLVLEEAKKQVNA